MTIATELLSLVVEQRAYNTAVLVLQTLDRVLCETTTRLYQRGLLAASLRSQLLAAHGLLAGATRELRGGR